MVNLDDQGKYQLRGYVDRLDQLEDRTYEIHDYKTSKSLPEQNKMDEYRQLALYQLGIKKMYKTDTVLKVNPQTLL